ncbi:hypothetical protein V6N11_082626 [Hibiscus sabdariffa]|uniref:Uncharacterized protein n=1 Tax=Hibiscus sabdariffa TaxID=183260 RepID=A0ABR2P9T0_9ROSI
MAYLMTVVIVLHGTVVLLLELPQIVAQIVGLEIVLIVALEIAHDVAQMFLVVLELEHVAVEEVEGAVDGVGEGMVVAVAVVVEGMVDEVAGVVEAIDLVETEVDVEPLISQTLVLLAQERRQL